jgi:hypothetical protein
MTQIDQFESVFKAADKPLYHYRPPALTKVLVVSDLADDAEALLSERLQCFVGDLAPKQPLAWESIGSADYASVGELLAHIERIAPDIVCTYRNLQTSAWRWPYALGDHLEVLTQATDLPVLVVPRPEHERHSQALQQRQSVMALTDHLTGDDQLVNFAVHFADPTGRLLLAHIEDEAVFERYMDVISKVPAIDTESARQAILERLLKEPADYIRSCQQVLASEGLALQVEKLVTIGHRIGQIKQLVEQHAVDLLVLNTKDQDQLAMHGLAYSLAVELRHLPLLML